MSIITAMIGVAHESLVAEALNSSVLEIMSDSRGLVSGRGWDYFERQRVAIDGEHMCTALRLVKAYDSTEKWTSKWFSRCACS